MKLISRRASSIGQRSGQISNCSESELTPVECCPGHRAHHLGQKKVVTMSDKNRQNRGNRLVVSSENQ